MNRHAFNRLGLLALLILGAVWKSEAAVIIDTGEGPNQSGISLHYADKVGLEWLAGQFTIGDDMMLTGVEGFIGNNRLTPGIIDISIARNTSGLPGELLFTGSFDIPGDPERLALWFGVKDVDWRLNAGTYWVVFAPRLEFLGYMPTRSTEPLDGYAIWNVTASEGFVRADWLGVGVRISGDLIPVPEPSTYGLFAALGLASVVAYRRRRNSADRIQMKSV